MSQLSSNNDFICQCGHVSRGSSYCLRCGDYLHYSSLGYSTVYEATCNHCGYREHFSSPVNKPCYYCRSGYLSSSANYNKIETLVKCDSVKVNVVKERSKILNLIK